MRRPLLVTLFILFFTAPALAGRVMVLPFQGVSSQDQQADLGPGITQAIQFEIARVPTMNFVTPESLPREHIGIGAACELARESSAEYAVLGSYQVSESQIRVSGYVVRTSDARIIATLKSTGQTSEFFAIQDALAEQVKRSLIQTLPSVATTQPSRSERVMSSGPVKARIDLITPTQWQSRQRDRLSQTGDASLRRSPGWIHCHAWHGWSYYGGHWPFWIP